MEWRVGARHLGGHVNEDGKAMLCGGSDLSASSPLLSSWKIDEQDLIPTPMSSPGETHVGVSNPLNLLINLLILCHYCYGKSKTSNRADYRVHQRESPR